MTRQIVLAVLVTALNLEAAVSIVGMRLPGLEDKALDGAVVRLPDDARGYVGVVAFAFKRESQADIDDWLASVSEEIADARRFRLYEVPMMGGGLVKLLRGTINNGMKGAVPAARRRFVVPFYGDINSYSRKLGMDDRSVVYVLLLDKQGVIRWSASGVVTGKKSAELTALARELAGL